jgi:carboxylesterase
MPLLEVTELAVSFGGLQALRGVSLRVERGESVSVLGANGAGKSTLLRALMGRAPRTGGTVLWNGEDITHAPTDALVAHGLALCPEGRQLFPAMSVEDNLLLGAYLAPNREARRRLDDIYGRFSFLRDRRRDLAGGFSGGEQQMIAIGRALMSRPQLLLMDEPSSGLSPIAIRQVRDILLQVRGAGMAILLVEQNVPLAVEISQRCYLLNRGLIEAAGATSDLMQDPALADAYLGGAGETSGSRQPTADNHPKEDAMSEGPVMSGAEPFFLRGGDTGILLSHGFTGTTQSMRYLGEALHRLGYTVSAPRLKGHGISPAAMAKSTAGEWVASLEDALAELRPQCKRVFIGGLSMGGALTLYMAGKHAGVFAGAFPINAVVHVDSPDLAGLAFDRNAPPAIPGVGSDIKDPAVKELAYPEVPVPAIKELFALIAVTRELLPRITCPTLILQSRDDHVVPPGNGKTIAGGVGAARVELVWLENSFHVATIDYDKDRIVAEVHRFIQSVLAS